MMATSDGLTVLHTAGNDFIGGGGGITLFGVESS